MKRPNRAAKDQQLLAEIEAIRGAADASRKRITELEAKRAEDEEASLRIEQEKLRCEEVVRLQAELQETRLRELEAARAQLADELRQLSEHEAELQAEIEALAKAVIKQQELLEQAEVERKAPAGCSRLVAHQSNRGRVARRRPKSAHDIDEYISSAFSDFNVSANRGQAGVSGPDNWRQICNSEPLRSSCPWRDYGRVLARRGECRG